MDNRPLLAFSVGLLTTVLAVAGDRLAHSTFDRNSLRFYEYDLSIPGNRYRHWADSARNILWAAVVTGVVDKIAISGKPEEALFLFGCGILLYLWMATELVKDVKESHTKSCDLVTECPNVQAARKQLFDAHLKLHHPRIDVALSQSVVSAQQVNTANFSIPARVRQTIQSCIKGLKTRFAEAIPRSDPPNSISATPVTLDDTQLRDNIVIARLAAEKAVKLTLTKRAYPAIEKQGRVLLVYSCSAWLIAAAFVFGPQIMEYRASANPPQLKPRVTANHSSSAKNSTVKAAPKKGEQKNKGRGTK